MKANLATDSWKLSVDDYVNSAKDLFDSMKALGFVGSIPIDPDGELLGGAHRVACVAALDIETIQVERCLNRVWAPAWTKAWFIEHGMPQEEADRLESDYARQ